MKLYYLKYSYPSSTHGLVAKHQWRLRCVECHKCESRSRVSGMIYTSVDLSSLENQELLTLTTSYSVEEFQEVKREIMKVVPPDIPLLPGVEYGKYAGRITGRISDFVLPTNGALMTTLDTIEKLESAGVRLPPYYETLLLRGRNPFPQFREFEIRPSIPVEPDTYIEPLQPACDVCGCADGGSMEKITPDVDLLPVEVKQIMSQYPGRYVKYMKSYWKLIVHERNITGKCDLFRSICPHGLLIATSNFVNAVRDLGITGLIFYEIEVRHS
jgi:Protein of unknown function (Gmx_para_CXXCG)